LPLLWPRSPPLARRQRLPKPSAIMGVLCPGGTTARAGRPRNRRCKLRQPSITGPANPRVPRLRNLHIPGPPRRAEAEQARGDLAAGDPRWPDRNHSPGVSVPRGSRCQVTSPVKTGGPHSAGINGLWKPSASAERSELLIKSCTQRVCRQRFCYDGHCLLP